MILIIAKHYGLAFYKIRRENFYQRRDGRIWPETWSDTCQARQTSSVSHLTPVRDEALPQDTSSHDSLSLLHGSHSWNWGQSIYRVNKEALCFGPNLKCCNVKGLDIQNLNIVKETQENSLKGRLNFLMTNSSFPVNFFLTYPFIFRVVTPMLTGLTT